MKGPSLERYRSFVKVLLGMAVLMVTATVCDLTSLCPPFSTTWLQRDASSTMNKSKLHIVSNSSPMSSLFQGTLDLAVEGDEEGMMNKCVAVRIKGHNTTLALEEALAILHVQFQGATAMQQKPIQVGLVFLDKPDGFISSGKVINQTGVFHLYHYLEFLLVAYHQLHQLLLTQLPVNQQSPPQEASNSSGHKWLSSPESPLQVPWIYVPLMQAPREVCGVANGINCQIADLLLTSSSSKHKNQNDAPLIPWYGMESNPQWLKDFHPAYHGQHKKRQWDEVSFPLDQDGNYADMQEMADIALIISLRRRDRCNHNGRNQHGWNAYSEIFPMEDWHASLVNSADLQSVPLPADLQVRKEYSSYSPTSPVETTPLAAFFTESPTTDFVVCYVDRQATPRRMPDSEHEWLIQYLSNHPTIRFWHLLMQNYDGIEQLRIASECDLMIGVHGNGLSHLLWMPPRRYVVEMYWDDKTRQGGYQLLAETMNHTYLALRNGLLVLDATHPNPAKQVQTIDSDEDPYVHGRTLIINFTERALAESGYARGAPPSTGLHHSGLHQHHQPTERTSTNKVLKEYSAQHSKHKNDDTEEEELSSAQIRVDDWGDTHPRQCLSQVKHIHLSVGRDPQREITVSFASYWSDSDDQPPVVAGVHYGTRPDQLEFFQAQEELPLIYNTTYPETSLRFSQVVTGNDLYFSPYQHHISLRNLEPETTYYYIPVLGKRNKEISLEEDIFLLAAKSWSDHPTQHLDNYRRNGVGKLVYDESRLQRRRFLAPKPYNGSKKSCPEINRVRSFTTAPRPTQQREHKQQEKVNNEPLVRFGILGDLGQFEHSQETLDHMFHNQDKMDAIVLVGDIAYTNNDHRRWDTFFDFLDDYPIFHTTPLQIAPGNHDVEKADGRNEIFQSYETRFRMPQVHPAQLGTLDGVLDLDMNEPSYPLPYEWGNAYYSFEYGPAKHIIVSAYSSMEPNSTQYQWLVRELESVDRDNTPWVLLTIHVPIYNSFEAHHKDLQISAAQTHLEPLMVQYSVNVVFSGHIHAYQRTKQVAFGELVSTGPMHVVVGASGRQCCLTRFASETPEPWIAARDGAHYGYGQFAIFNRTHAEWEWIPTSSSLIDKGKSLTRDAVVLENQYFSSNTAS